MGISNFTLERIFNEIYQKIDQAKIDRIINITENDFLFTLFKDNSTSNVLLSLDPSLPIIVQSKSYRVDNHKISNANCNLLKKYIEHGFITKVEKVKNDRIIIFDIKKWSPSFQLMETKMIFELFPLSPNIIFTDSNYKILDAFKHSEGLESKHPIFRGLTYEFPLATDKHFDKNTVIEEMKGKVNKSEYKYLSSLSKEEYQNAIERMLNEKNFYIYKNDVSSLKIFENSEKVKLSELYDKILEKKSIEDKENRYHHIYKLVEQKIKSAKKRIINIENDKQRFINCEDLQEKGNLLYLGNDIYQKGMTEITIEGNKIDLDPRYNLFENAQRYFKMYKKAKSGLIQVEIQKNNAIEELDYFQRIATQLSFATHEDIQEIILDLVENHYIKNTKIQKKETKKPGNKKYTPHFLNTSDGTKIGYGLSSYQNEELTFSLARKNDYYLHIKDFHGPHVILFDENPSEDNLLFAGEIALYFANQQSGEVYYTKRYNVKKVSGKRGLVTMNSQKTMIISKIRESTLMIIKRK